jgi:sugar O-acyltransferase (sialic acid O-acetyltransferase NeuD family)
MPESLVLIGGGGHCRSCIDVVESAGFRIAGIIDRTGNTIFNYPVLGDDDKIPSLVKDHFFLVTVGQIKNPEIRKRIYEDVKQAGGKFHSIIASTAIVSKHSFVGEGTIVMHHCLVNAGVQVGANCIINSKALIEHDCTVADHTHISTAAIVNGGCNIGSGVFIGSHSVISQGITIADNVVIGAGSVVIKNISEPGTYAGNPARKIK